MNPWHPLAPDLACAGDAAIVQHRPVLLEIQDASRQLGVLLGTHDVSFFFSKLFLSLSLLRPTDIVDHTQTNPGFEILNAALVGHELSR